MKYSKVFEFRITESLPEKLMATRTPMPSKLRTRVSFRALLVITGVLCIFPSMLLTGCKRPEAGENFVAGFNADTFSFAVAGDPQTLDPGRMSGAPEGRIAFNIFEGLMMPGPTTEGLDDPSDVVVPGVAHSYELSEDGRVYRFHLREDAKWSNGEMVTSRDFERSWQRVLTPGFPGDYVQKMWVIKNGEAYSTGALSDWSQVGVKSLDDHTLEVTLNEPTPYFPELVAFYTFFPVPMDLIESLGDDAVKWTRPENIISNGPYELTSYRPQQDMTLEKNPHYWDADNVPITKALVRIIDDTNAVVNAYRTGALHWTGTSLPVAQIASLLTHPDYTTEPMLGTYYFRINVADETSPLADEKVRRALALAIDRRSLVEETMNNLYVRADTFVPPMDGWDPIAEPLSYNPSEARRLLAEAGYPDGEGFPEFEFLYNTDENHKLIAEAVQAMWIRNLGVRVTLVNKEWRSYLQDVSTLNYQMARAGWIGDYNDPTTFLDLWESTNGNNNTGWADEEYDALLAEARKEADPDQRLEYLKEAERIVMERGPIIPVYYYTNNFLVSDRLEGFHPHNRDIHLLRYMRLPDAENSTAATE